MNNDPLTQLELAELIGVAPQTLNDWKRKGLPYTKDSGAGRRKVCMFEPAAVLEWCANNNRAEAAWRIKEAHFPNVSDEPLSVEEGADLDPLQQADYMLAQAFARYVGCESDLPGLQIQAQEAWEKAIDTRRKLRNDHAKSEQALGAVMPVGEHKRLMVEAHSAVAQALKRLPRYLTTKLKNKTPQQFMDIITKAVRDCMKSLSDGEPGGDGE